MVDIIISKKFIQDKYWTIIKNSKKEDGFINELKNVVSNINTTNIPDRRFLEKIVQEFALISENLWNKYSKYVRITKHSKAWQNEECSRKLDTYYLSKSSLDWKSFKETVMRTKRSFFNKKIQEIASKNKRL